MGEKEPSVVLGLITQLRSLNSKQMTKKAFRVTSYVKVFSRQPMRILEADGKQWGDSGEEYEYRSHRGPKLENTEIYMTPCRKGEA